MLLMRVTKITHTHTSTAVSNDQRLIKSKGQCTDDGSGDPLKHLEEEVKSKGQCTDSGSGGVLKDPVEELSKLGLLIEDSFL